MELEDFIKTEKDQKFLSTTYSHQIFTKDEVLAEIREKMQQWLAVGERPNDIKNGAVEYVLRDIAPYSDKLEEKTEKLMKKWGLVH